MTEYEFDIFSDKCPYTGEPCTNKEPCLRCRMNEEERQLMEKLLKQENSQIDEV
jgi:hypothetical protein